MSHLGDVAPAFYSSGSGPGGPIPAFVTLILGLVIIVWAFCLNNDSQKLCQQHGEKCVVEYRLRDGRIYTLCEKSDGTVIKR